MGIDSGSKRCAFSLACCIGSFSMACGSIMAMGSNEKVSMQRGLFLTSLSLVYFVSLTDFFNKYFMETNSGRKFRKKYKLLISDVMDISNKLVSAIQATLSCIAGIIVCKSSCRISFLTASHYMSDTYAWFGTAYFIYDLWSMYKVHVQKIADKLYFLKEYNDPNANDAMKANKQYDKLNGIATAGKTSAALTGNNYMTSESDDKILYTQKIAKKMEKIPLENTNFLQYCWNHPVMTFHHMFLVSLGLSAVVYLRGGSGDCIFGFVYLMELSTPFVSFRSILSIMDMKNSNLYIANGLIMLFLFFICRVLIGPYVLYLYMEIVNLTMFQTIVSLSPLCKLISFFLFFPQLYWFYLMFNGAVKVFFPKTKRYANNNDTTTNMINKLHSGATGEYSNVQS